jgi:hypothetical protein
MLSALGFQIVTVSSVPTFLWFLEYCSRFWIETVLIQSFNCTYTSLGLDESTEHVLRASHLGDSEYHHQGNVRVHLQ